MIRWLRRPRPRATAPVLLLRAVCGLTIMGLYIALRLPHLISPVELAATWAGAVLVGGIVLAAIEQLAVRQRDRLAPGEPSVLELTEQFEVPLGWPGSVENQIAEARHAAMVPLIDNGEVVEPRLFTHDYDAMHHTPPRGFRADFLRQLYSPPRHDDGREPAADLIRRIRAERPSPTGRVVVSHTAPVEITRDRFGQLFGGL